MKKKWKRILSVVLSFCLIGIISSPTELIHARSIYTDDGVFRFAPHNSYGLVLMEYNDSKNESGVVRIAASYTDSTKSTPVGAINGSVFKEKTMNSYYQETQSDFRAIGNYAFAYATVENDLVFKSITNGVISSHAFDGVTVGGNLAFLAGTINTICEYGFANISVGKQFTIPKKIEYMDAHAFDGANLKSFILHDSLKKIGSCIFANCSRLNTITLPETNNAELKVAEDALPNQEGLTYIVPAGLTDLSVFHLQNHDQVTFSVDSSLTGESPVIQYLKENNLQYVIEGDKTPVAEPTATPTEEPTVEPTETPTVELTATPTEEPTVEPTEIPTEEPTLEPTATPTEEPTVEPTETPTEEPVEEPVETPTEEPTVEPTETMAAAPTEEPTEAPTEEPIAAPTVEPTETSMTEPTAEPVEEPVETPTEEPTVEPTETMAAAPTVEPTETPTTIAPTVEPTETPTVTPTAVPTVTPTAAPVATPTTTVEIKSGQVPTSQKQEKTNKNVVKNGICYRIYKSNYAEVTGARFSKSIRKVIIPDTITYNGKLYKVTAISNKAFRNCKKLSIVTIGDYVKTIGKEAFAGCSRLKKISFGKRIVTIKSKAMYQDKKMKKVILNTKVLKTIGKKAFGGLPKTVEVIMAASKVKEYQKLLAASKK